MARALTDRLGRAELLWSRVSREPDATFAGRPGTPRCVPAQPRPARTWSAPALDRHRMAGHDGGRDRSGRAAARLAGHVQVGAGARP